jgi:hypothetical protein
MTFTYSDVMSFFLSKKPMADDVQGPSKTKIKQKLHFGLLPETTCHRTLLIRSRGYYK